MQKIQKSLISQCDNLGKTFCHKKIQKSFNSKVLKWEYLKKKKIQKSLISECHDLEMTKVFKKNPKILDFQSCGSVNNLGNEKNPEILDLINCDDLGKTKKDFWKSKNPWFPIGWTCQYCKKWKKIQKSLISLVW